MRTWWALLSIILWTRSSSGLDNGLARTPPMGWLSWERFLCNVDCVNDPENCISENLYMTMADIMYKEGYQKVGYQYVNIDDCWMSGKRDPDGRLQPNSTRFPSGIRSLADFVHERGLKLGIYQDCGTKTCGGYPGSFGHYKDDAQTYADWAVDMLKLDGCYMDPILMDRMYPTVTAALNATGREIVFSCSWPAYQVDKGIKPDYPSIAKYCNMWRNFDDIQDSWESVLSIVDYYASVQEDLIAVSGPGAWSDPDMLVIGNYGLSIDQSRAQMALWAVLAAPLFMSVDLRTIKPEHKEILMNERVIAINQDRMGRMGRRVHKGKGIEIWTRWVLPLADDDSPSMAVVFFNRREMGGPVNVTLTLSSLGLNYRGGYDVTDLFEHELKPAQFMPHDNLTATVNPSGVVMLKAVPIAHATDPLLLPETARETNVAESYF